MKCALQKGFTIFVTMHKLTFFVYIYVTAMSTVLYSRYIFTNCIQHMMKTLRTRTLIYM